jgi:hypothetical protein
LIAGHFCPLDAYSSLEIEGIADEALGHKRRNLLDELRSDHMRNVHLSLAESKRALEANADRIRMTRRAIDDLTEQIEELGDVRVRLSTFEPSDRESAEDFRPTVAAAAIGSARDRQTRFCRS